MPASGSSSELSSHQMAIHSHPGVQKIPASGISSELSAHQMAPPGAIAHSRARLCPRASPFSFSSLVSPLRSLGMGLLGRCDPRSFFFFYDVTDAGPASHRVRLWQRGPASTILAARRSIVWRLWYSYPSSSSMALPEVFKRPWPLWRPRGDGNGGRFVRSPCLPSWRGLRLLYAVHHQMLSLFGPCTAMVH